MQLSHIKLFASLKQIYLLCTWILWESIYLLITQEERDVASWCLAVVGSRCWDNFASFSPRVEGAASRTSLLKAEEVGDLSDAQPFVHRHGNEPLESPKVFKVVFGELCLRE